MASVAICPHCYVQLIVPARVGDDARVECPACGKQFELGQAVLRAVPEVVVVDRQTAKTETAAALATVLARKVAVAEPHVDVAERNDPVEQVEQADQGIAAWFGAHETVPEVTSRADAGAEAKTQAGENGVEAAEQPDEISEPAPLPSLRPAAATLADLQPPRAEPLPPTLSSPPPAAADAVAPDAVTMAEIPLGPTFDLPNVPLTRDNGATLEFGADSPLGSTPSTDFEFDDVDFDASKVTIDEFAAERPAYREVAAATGPRSADDNPTPASLLRVGAAPVVIPTVPRRQPRSPLRLLVGVAVSGVVGLVIGCLLLLFILGPEGDIFGVTRYVPRMLLPTSFQEASTQLAASATATPHTAETPTDLESESESANVAASYEAPIESAGKRPDEPPHVIGAPSYTTDELAAALNEARRAQPGLMSGDLGDASARRTKGTSYAKLCDLAQVSTFQSDAATGSRREQLERDAEELLRQTLADARTRDEVTHIATVWIDFPNRRHGGVLLVGSIRGGQIAGDMYQYELSTSDGHELAILLSRPLDADLSISGQPLAISGAIVDHPADQIVGYTGDAARAIWVGRVIPLE
jgi:hypothetical protein